MAGFSMLAGVLNHWKVDEVIECLEVTDHTRKTLMLFAPLAYCGNGVELATIWPQLPQNIQDDVIKGVALLDQEIEQA